MSISKRYGGRVGRGMGRGRNLGFPTANISMHDQSLSGSFAGIVYLQGKMYPAAVYADTYRGLLEAYIFDFDQDIYGEEIEIHLLQQVAPTKRVKTDEELKAYIAACVEAAKDYFKDTR